MAFCRNEHRGAALHVAALCAFTSFASCSLDSEPKAPGPDEPPPIGSSSKPTAREAPTRARVPDGSVLDADIKVATGQQQSAPQPDAGNKKQPQQPTTPPTRQLDAGKAADAASPQSSDAAATAPPATMATMQQPAQMNVMDGPCARMRLRERAEAYLRAMATGDTMTLRVHASFRYTENGRDEQLGAGAWLRRAESQFSRHVLDETRCSTITQAVMNGVTGRFSFGVRLRYVDDQLLEAEAQVVPEALADTDLNAVIPVGTDAFAAEVPSDMRLSRDMLFELAQRYFDSVNGVATVPPSAPDCRRRQNGVPLGDGSCARPPGMTRFEQQRIEIADELSGIVTATVLYENHIGLYLLKIANNMVQNIEVIGGATSQSTGW